jgi:hypothetical protein
MRTRRPFRSFWPDTWDDAHTQPAIYSCTKAQFAYYTVETADDPLHDVATWIQIGQENDCVSSTSVGRLFYGC